METSLEKLPVIIAHECRIIHSGLKNMLSKNRFLKIEARTRSAAETLTMLESCKKAVVFIDPMLPGFDSKEFPGTVKQRYPGTILIVCSNTLGYTWVELLNDKVIDGYFVKTASVRELEEAVHAALEHKTYLGKNAKEKLEELKLDISDREKEVMNFLLDGLSVKEIAAELGISPDTVYTHRENILKKTNTKSEVDLVYFAIQKGIITIEQIMKWKKK